MFSDLLEIHKRLEEALLKHQKLLLHFEFDAALDALCEYEQQILAHMADEETLMLPIYSERGEIQRSGSVKSFLDDHDKLREHLTLFKQEVAKLKDEDDPDSRIIWLFGREAFFKKLNDHHDIRETNFLYPELDRITTDAEKAEIFSRLTCDLS